MQNIDNTKNFPMKVRFGEKPSTEYFNSQSCLNLEMLSFPSHDFRRDCVKMMLATWKDEPVKNKELTHEDVAENFKKILSMKVLPNSLESLHFQFRVDGLTLIEVTHLLRHRMFSSIHAQCSADRFLQHDSVFIPTSIENSQFADRYRKLSEECKELYCDMVDSRDISILDARYILTRNHRYFYYFGCNLKDAIAFINQRKCTAIQPELDNIFAHQMFERISSIIPEIKDVVSLNCSPQCFFVTSDSEDSSRVNYPDENHERLIRQKYGDTSERLDKNYYLFHKKRSEMGISLEQKIT